MACHVKKHSLYSNFHTSEMVGNAKLMVLSTM